MAYRVASPVGYGKVGCPDGDWRYDKAASAVLDRRCDETPGDVRVL